MSAFTAAQRSAHVAYTIDPGFLHFRRVETVLGPTAVTARDRQIRALPDLPEGLRLTRLRQIYTRGLLKWCETTKTPPLAVRIARNEGGAFCSVENLSGCGHLHGRDRATNIRIDPTCDRPVEVHYSTEYVTSSTLRSRLAQGAELAIVGSVEIGDPIRVEPLLMGTPWPEPDNPEVLPSLEWYVEEWARVPLEQIDQFARVSERSLPANSTP